MSLGVLSSQPGPGGLCALPKPALCSRQVLVLLIAAARRRGGGTSLAPRQAQPLPSSCTQHIPCYQVPKEQLSMNQPRGRKINVFLPVCKCEVGNEAPPNAAPTIRPLQESQGTSFPNNWRKRRKKKKIQTLFFYPQGSSSQESPEAAGSLLHPWGDCSSLCWEKGMEHYLRKQWGEECVCKT